MKLSMRLKYSTLL